MELSLKSAKDKRTVTAGKLHLAIYFWVLSFLKKYLLMVVSFLLLSLFFNGLSLSIPILIQHLIDVTLPSKDKVGLYTIFGYLLISVCLFLSAKAASNLLQRIITERTLRDIQIYLFSQLRRLGFAYYERHPSGRTLTIFTTEVKAITKFYRELLPFFVTDCMMVIISVAMIFHINFMLSLILIPSLLLQYILGANFAKKAAMSARVMRDHKIAAYQTVYNFLSGMQEIRVNVKEPWVHKLFYQKFHTYRGSAIIDVVWIQCRRIVKNSLIHFGLFFVFIVGIPFVREGKISVGEFISFVLYYEVAITQLTLLITNMTEQRMLMYELERIYEMAIQEPEVSETRAAVALHELRGEIELKNVYFSYHSKEPLLKGVQLHIQAGEHVAIVGTSGNGKSTLLKLLGRFYDPDDGDILMDGVSLREMSFEQIRNKVGFVFQETYLFGDTVKENIRFGNPTATEDEIIQAAKAAYAHDFISELPHGYDTLVGERGLRLSGGQKQRIAIARMFIKNPNIIILDEATSALDNISEAKVKRAIDSLIVNKTTIAIAHRITTVKDYDKIVVLEQGQVAEVGTYDELMNRRGLFTQLVNGRTGPDGKMDVDF